MATTLSSSKVAPPFASAAVTANNCKLVWAFAPPSVHNQNCRLFQLGLSNKSTGAPYLARFMRDVPDFLHAALDKTAYAPFFKERRRLFVEPANLDRKSGMWDTTAFDLRTSNPNRALNEWKAVPYDSACRRAAVPRSAQDSLLPQTRRVYESCCCWADEVSVHFAALRLSIQKDMNIGTAG
jgi:hypothetical protein